MDKRDVSSSKDYSGYAKRKRATTETENKGALSSEEMDKLLDVDDNELEKAEMAAHEDSW